MKDILRIAAPFTLWIVAFSAIYGIEGMLCSRHGARLDGSDGRLPLIVAWLVAIALQGALLWALASRRHGSPLRFGRVVSVTLGVSALLATIWTLMPVAALPTCRAGGGQAAIYSGSA